MYIELVDFCNMSCAHCVHGVVKTGNTMSFETFKKCCEWKDPITGFGKHMALGGGEPTLHPQFLGLVHYALGLGKSIIVTTNGSQTEKALALADLAREGRLTAILSLDEWHDKIDPIVIESWCRHNENTILNDELHAKMVDHGDTPEGRLAIRRTTKDDLFDLRCAKIRNGIHKLPYQCHSTFVNPKGEIRSCWHRSSPTVGHVDSGIVLEKWNVGFVPCRFMGTGIKDLEEAKKK